MVPLDKAGITPPPKSDSQRAGVLKPIYDDVFRRIHRRMVQDIEAGQKRLKDDPTKFTEWLDELFVNLRGYMMTQLLPPVRAHYALQNEQASDELVRDIAEQVAREYCSTAQQHATSGVDSHYFDFLLQQSVDWTDKLANRSVSHG
jgi:hypothetical protein